MATTLPIRKIYIDSRWCTPDSVSSSNFKVQVPRTMQMPPDTVFCQRRMHPAYLDNCRDWIQR